MGITLLVLTILTLLTGLGFLAWKMQLQKKVIDHLAGIVFRDVNQPPGSESGVGVTISNGVSHNAVGSTRGNSDLNPFPSSVG